MPICWPGGSQSSHLIYQTGDDLGYQDCASDFSISAHEDVKSMKAARHYMELSDRFHEDSEQIWSILVISPDE
jgi:hypothetical protein